MDLPKNLRYSEYVWVKLDGDVATLGITDYGLEMVKEIVFVDLPKKAPIEKGQNFVSLESVKWSGHIASPVGGEIIEVNESLFDEPEKLNKSPYESWVCKIKLSNPSDADELMDAAAAEKWVTDNL